VSFDWRKHSECWAAKPPGDEPRGTGPCNADRAVMISEGERLQALVNKLTAEQTVFAITEGMGTIAELKAENARLQRIINGLGLIVEGHKQSEARTLRALDEATRSLEWIGRASLQENDVSELSAYARNRGLVARAFLPGGVKP
jgi:hypothetical protein